MSELFNEELISLARAAQTLPNRPHVSTLWRWSGKGIKGVRLETVLMGGRRFTSAKYLADFFAKLTTGPATELIPSSRRLQQQDAAAKQAATLF